MWWNRLYHSEQKEDLDFSNDKTFKKTFDARWYEWEYTEENAKAKANIFEKRLSMLDDANKNIRKRIKICESESEHFCRRLDRSS